MGGDMVLQCIMLLITVTASTCPHSICEVDTRPRQANCNDPICWLVIGPEMNTGSILAYQCPSVGF